MRHKHSLSHYRLLTGDLGKIYPVGCVEVLPGDTAQHAMSALVRLTPMSAPVMHRANVRVHHFFVPHRLTWDPSNSNSAGDTFENFITGGSDGDDAQTVPTVTPTRSAGDLLDYLGVPVVASAAVNAMPLRAYNLIYNEYYRDQDLVTSIDNEANNAIQKCAWAKDYLTTARPWAQKGTAVTLPLGTSAPVKGIGKANQTFPDTSVSAYETGESGSSTFASAALMTDTVNTRFRVEEDPNNAGFPGIFADLSAATGIGINEVRRAFALQRFAEARARFGSRYLEYLRYLGVTPPDARIQRPEYLGGGSSPVNISEVIQTAPETDQTSSTEYGTGDLYGHGVSALRSGAYRRMFTEHGYIISLMSTRPEAVYTNGVARHWLKSDREDFFQKELQHIGQQEVWDGEVYLEASGNADTFGYQDRYGEYRGEPSCVAGEFRSTLNYWHLGREFGAAPSLNSTFVECSPSKRIFNEQSAHSLWCMVRHRLVMRRLVERGNIGRIL